MLLFQPIRNSFEYNQIFMFMKIGQTAIYIFIIILFVGCTSRGNRKRSSFVFNTTEETAVLPILPGEGEKIKVEQPLPRMKASELVESYKYIPLETKEESFMGYIRKVVFYEDRIYIRDVETNSVYIFDLTGKYINKVGKKGQAPGEFTTLLFGMVIDPFNNRLLVYDQGNRKMNYFTLDGDYLFSRNVPMILDGSFVFASPNCILVSNHKNIENGYLGEWDDYRIVQLDSTLQIAGGGYKYDDNVYAKCLFPIFPTSNVDILFQPMFTNDFYSVSPKGLKRRYSIDYSRFDNVIDTARINRMTDGGEIYDYMFATTYVEPQSVETKDFFWFKTYPQSDSKAFNTFYDKNSKRSISFRKMVYDVDFMFTYIESCYEDYFVGVVEPASLKSLREAYIENNMPGTPEVMQMIEKLKDDDNSVLVLFKPKPLKRYE